MLRWLAAGLVLCTGCAGLKVTAVGSNNDDQLEGIRYYESSPYLLVHTDNEGGLVTKILYLPDQTKLMSAKPFNFMASSKSTLKFQNGVLTSAKSTVDETAIPVALIGAISKAVQAQLAWMTFADKEEHKVPAPYLFKIKICRKDEKGCKEGEVVLKGGPGLDLDERPMTITVTPPQKPTKP